MNLEQADAVATATAIRSGNRSAKAVISATLDRIDQQNPTLNCFTAITSNTALSQAEAIDSSLARGNRLGVMVGVPFAVKKPF